MAVKRYFLRIVLRVIENISLKENDSKYVDQGLVVDMWRTDI